MAYAYFHRVFDNYEEAKRYQREKLQFCLDLDIGIRDACIRMDTDFDTKEERWLAFVRGMEEIPNGPE